MIFDTNRFSFWHQWLFVVSLIIALFGLALAFFNQTPPFNLLFNNQVNPSFWRAETIPPQARLFQQWVYGVLGMTVCGWGIFMVYVVFCPFQRKEKWSWNCFALGVLIWFLGDTAISLYFKVGFNAIFNTLLFLAVMVPLVFTRKHFT